MFSANAGADDASHHPTHKKCDQARKMDSWNIRLILVKGDKLQGDFTNHWTPGDPTDHHLHRGVSLEKRVSKGSVYDAQDRCPYRLVLDNSRDLLDQDGDDHKTAIMVITPPRGYSKAKMSSVWSKPVMMTRGRYKGKVKKLEGLSQTPGPELEAVLVGAEMLIYLGGNTWRIDVPPRKVFAVEIEVVKKE